MDSFFSITANCLVRFHHITGKGDPIIFIHGLGCASSYEYPKVIASDKFGGKQAILIDLPGCGYSEKPKGYDYSLTNQAKVVIEMIKHLGLKNLFIYGHSMGGSISIEIADMLEDELLGLIVSEPNFHPGGGFFSRQICASSENDFVSSVCMKMVNRDKSPWAGTLAINSPWCTWRSANDLLSGKDWLTLFLRNPVDKMVIFGNESLPDEDFDILFEKGIQTKILPDCGHCMSWEKPHSLAEAISTFVDNITSKFYQRS